MSAEPVRGKAHPIAVLALMALLASSIVLATSFAVDYPELLLSFAWLIALVGLIAIVLTAWRISRSSGASWFTSLGRTLQSAGRFILDFF